MTSKSYSLDARRKGEPSFRLAAPPDGRFLVVGGPRGELRVLTPNASEEILRLDGPPGAPCRFWLVHHGRALLVETEGRFQLLDPCSGATLASAELARIEPFRAISQDLAALAVGSPVARLDLHTGVHGEATASHGEWVRYESDFERVEEVPILATRFSLDGSWLATGGDDGSILLWRSDNQGFTQTHAYQVPESPLVKQLHTERAQDLCPALDLVFSPDGRYLAVGSRGRVLLFATPGNGDTAAPLLEVAAAVYWAKPLHFSPDGQRFVCNEAALQAWETATGRYLGRVLDRPQADDIGLLSGDLLASVHADGRVLVGPANWQP